MNDYILTVVFAFSVVTPAAIGSFILQKRLINNDNFKYKWGFYLGLQSIILSLSMFGVFYIFVTDGNIVYFIEEYFVFLLIFFILFFFGIQTIRLRKWAFIVLTVMSINPIIWFATISYYNKRKLYFYKSQNSLNKIENNESSLFLLKKYVKSRLINFNQVQKVFFAFGLNGILLILSVIAMNGYGESLTYRYDNAITDFEKVWFGWVIYFLLMASVNIFLFSDKNNSKLNIKKEDTDE